MQGQVPTLLLKVNPTVACGNDKANRIRYGKWCERRTVSYELATTATVEYYSVGDMQSDDYVSGIWVPIKKMKS